MENTTDASLLNFMNDTKEIRRLCDINSTTELLMFGCINATSNGKPSLQSLNDEEVQRLVPTVVLLSFISVSGIAGNSLAIYIYKTKIPFSNTQCFVSCLSAIDLCSCCVAIPFEISTILQQYTFESVWLCKLARFFNTLCSNSASFLLIFIAAERFRKVCRPLGWQIKPGVLVFLCVLSLVLGTSLSIPAIFIYGKHSFYIPEANLTGSECSIADRIKATSIPYLYALMFTVLFVSGVIILTVLYCVIGRKLRTQELKMNASFKRNTQIKTLPNQSRARKTSLLMFCVTIAYVVSFVPHLTLIIIRNSKKDFIESLSKRDKAVYKFFLRSYFLNNAINPIIYSVWDSRFKTACKNMFARRSS